MCPLAKNTDSEATSTPGCEITKPRHKALQFEAKWRGMHVRQHETVCENRWKPSSEPATIQELHPSTLTKRLRRCWQRSSFHSNPTRAKLEVPPISRLKDSPARPAPSKNQEEAPRSLESDASHPGLSSDKQFSRIALQCFRHMRTYGITPRKICTARSYFHRKQH